MKNIGDLFQGIKEGQKDYAENFSAIINSILLFFVYIFGIGPIYLFAKIFKKSFLDFNIDKNRKTYWNNSNLTKKPMGDYFKQF